MWCCADLTPEEIRTCIERGETISTALLEAQGLHDIVQQKRESAT
jgi:hypothetical protein